MKHYLSYLVILYILGSLSFITGPHGKLLEKSAEPLLATHNLESHAPHTTSPQVEETQKTTTETNEGYKSYFSLPTFGQFIGLITSGVIIHLIVLSIFAIF